jgi:hypothetical protein
MGSKHDREWKRILKSFPWPILRYQLASGYNVRHKPSLWSITQLNTWQFKYTQLTATIFYGNIISKP